MGLDILVKTTGKEVRESLSYDDCGVQDRSFALSLINEKDFPDKENIHTRPGGYGGLHRVRQDFIRENGLENEPTTLDKDHSVKASHRGYHLLSHSDCDG